MVQNAGIESDPPPPGSRALAVLAACICAVWILPGLVGHDPWKPDEAYTFGLVHSVLEGGSWVVPTLAGEPLLDHPPLYVLVAAATARLFDPWLPPHDGARLASGLFLALALAFAGGAGRELYGRGRGWVAAVVAAGSLGLVVRAHQMIPDTAQFAGVAIGVYGLALALRRPLAGGAWLGVGTGLAFMASGPLLSGVLALAALALPLVGRSWRSRDYAATLAVALLAALPWFAIWPLALWRESHELFAQWLALANPYAHLLDPHAAAPDLLHYLRILPWYAWPALPLALWVLWSARLGGHGGPGIQLPLTVFLLALVALSFGPDARELYAMPMLVPLALLATPSVDTLRRGAANAFYWFGVMGFTFFAVVGWVYWSALELGVPARLSAHLHRLQPGYVSGVRVLGLALAAMLCVAWVALLAGLKRLPERPFLVWTAGMALVWGMLTTLFIGYFDAGKSYRGMIASMQAALPPAHRCVASRGLGEPQRAMLHYYAGILTLRQESTLAYRSCDVLLVQALHPSLFVDDPKWRLVWDGARPRDDDEHFWLYVRER